MHKTNSILIALIMTFLLVTACGTKEEKAATEIETREYVLSAFPIPEAFKADSRINWTITDDKNTSGNLTVDLVIPDAATVDANSFVQDFLDRAMTINKDGKVTIQKLDIQIKDINQNPLVLANYVFNGQEFDGTYWSTEAETPLQGATQDTNLTYPIQPQVPAEVPTTYP